MKKVIQLLLAFMMLCSFVGEAQVAFAAAPATPEVIFEMDLGNCTPENPKSVKDKTGKYVNGITYGAGGARLGTIGAKKYLRFASQTEDKTVVDDKSAVVATLSDVAPNIGNADAVTIELWARGNALDGIEEKRRWDQMFAFGDDYTTGTAYTFSMQINSGAYFSFYPDRQTSQSGYNAYYTGGKIHNEKWCHYVVTRVWKPAESGTGGTWDCVIYVNGEVKNSSSKKADGRHDYSKTATRNYNDILIGGTPAGSSFIGDIATFKLYHGALSAAEIQSAYTAQKGDFPEASVTTVVEGGKTPSVKVSVNDSFMGITAPTVKTASGDIIETVWQDNTIRFPYGLPVTGQYTASAKTLGGKDISFAFNAEATDVALYDFKLSDDKSGMAVTDLTKAKNVSFQYKVTAKSREVKIWVASYRKNRLVDLEASEGETTGQVSVKLTEGADKLSVYIWDKNTMAPLFAPIEVDAGVVGPDALEATAALINAQGAELSYFEGETGVKARVSVKSGVQVENLTATLKWVTGTTINSKTTETMTLVNNRASVDIPFSGAAKFGDELVIEVADKNMTYLKKRIPYENPKNVVDILLVAGQSNALGQGGDKTLSIKPEMGTVYYNTMGNTTLSTEGNTGWDSHLAKIWHEETGRTVLLVKAAWGGTGFETRDGSTAGSERYGRWDKGNGYSPDSQPRDCYTAAKNLYNAAVKSIDTSKYTIGRRVYFWNQGENENAAYSAAEYEEVFMQLHNNLKTEFGTETTRLQYGAILPVRGNIGKVANLELTGPRIAQYHMGATEKDLQIVMDATEHWYSDESVKSWFETKYADKKYPFADMPNAWLGGIMNSDKVHYTQLAMNEFGEEAARNMLAYLRGDQETDGIDVITPGGIKHFKDGDTIALPKEGVIPVTQAKSGKKATFKVEGTVAALDTYGVLTAKEAIKGDTGKLIVSIEGRADMTFTLTSPLETDILSIAPVKDNKDAIYTLIFDDGYKNTAAWLDAELRKLDLKGTMALIPDQMGSGRTMTWTEAESYVNKADTVWGVANHTKGHKQGTFTTLTEAQLDTEINTGRSTLRSHFPNQKVVGLVTPGGQTSDLIIKKAKEQHLGMALAGGTSPALPLQGNTLYGLYRAAVYARAWADTSVPLANTFKGYVDAAISDKKWLIDMWHGVGGTDTKGDDATGDQEDWDGNVSETTASAYLTYIAEKKNAGKLWVTTFDEALVYAAQRQETKLSLVEKTDSKIVCTATLPAALDRSIYDATLTVCVKLPSGWTNASVSDANGSVSSAIKEGVLHFNITNAGGTFTIQKA